MSQALGKSANALWEGGLYLNWLGAGCEGDRREVEVKTKMKMKMKTKTKMKVLLRSIGSGI